MVRQIIVVSVLQRLDTAAASVRWSTAPLADRPFRVDYRIELICVSLEEGEGCDQLVGGRRVDPP